MKELDTVNDKIKLILANKREPTTSHPQNHQRSSNSLKKTFEVTAPKKMTSLFNNEDEIVESKVEAPSWTKSKEKYRMEPSIVGTERKKQS